MAFQLIHMITFKYSKTGFLNFFYNKGAKDKEETKVFQNKLNNM